MASLACCALQGLCSGASCVMGCCGRTAALHQGVRLVYFVFFLLTSVLAWVLVAFGADWLQNTSCCSHIFGPLSAYKLTFAFSVFHLLLGLIVIGVTDAHSSRGAIHNGWWGPKFIVWLGLLAGFMFLPQSFLTVYPWISLVGSLIFTVIQLFMLVDFAHTWNESWVDKYHETNNKNWFRLLLTVTITFLLLVLVGSILMFVFLRDGGPQCSYNALNVAFIGSNLLVVAVCCALSILPSIQSHNPRASLMTASIVGVYSTYLIASAIFSEPVDAVASCSYQQASPNEAFRIVTLVVGALITFVSVAFSSMRAGSHTGTVSETSRLTINKDGSSSDDDNVAKKMDEEDDIEAQKRKDRELLNLDQGRHHDEHAFEPVAYNYSWFHAVMLLGSMYIGSLMCNWDVVVAVVPGGSTLSVDKSIVSVWLKVVSAWVVGLLYIWTLVAPMVLRNRDFGQ